MKEKSIIGLGLESSCDETSAAIVADGKVILANIINSQIDLHSDYSGVVPEIASRAHLENINIIIEEALKTAGISFYDLDYVAATNRPGLIGSLLIALQSAKAISFTLNIPLVAINHLEAHLYAPFLEGNELSFPFIGLLVSGGNTALYKVIAPGQMQLLGKTVDDAVGEAFDKVSKYLGLGYPGGPVIEKIAASATERKLIFPKILPDPGDRRFSYSGIKTAVINYLKSNPQCDISEVAYAFQERALEILVRRLFDSARELGIKTLVVAGGVAANGRLREMILSELRPDERVMFPSPKLCTDNGAMIAGLAYHYFMSGKFDSLNCDVMSRV
ncbi:MAG TPA: tRNA (adenosine(37)-N6)-threonylcarbamoyltransferase complex transferase subunit TsaD [Spirochaetota bacterium]|nr:tRNA (adenosine(37)-N6)-threonylcarbamoyltransferase complex transferase subunit TsaD [Spirochaetota bacterium]HOK91966.1 tRNA (adenosine(37)-N6)-threonylcarbamoyltransferase complex transferase subunit TsaD [Spirochaetota bacterium]HON15104.1 tRNA (adenosine(37)-N6)-threonylcarbamoyltransferase complex transferase subunit TsaD [Spirochaetota bacterium]HPP94775.1 tRNA (adenosine(37)-N6)-threonylcarbamoyltransferase complex transferase subunit TsaD [Spirochaetota bacterium]HRS62370.1 tRNA (ad